MSEEVGGLWGDEVIGYSSTLMFLVTVSIL